MFYISQNHVFNTLHIYILVKILYKNTFLSCNCVYLTIRKNTPKNNPSMVAARPLQKGRQLLRGFTVPPFSTYALMRYCIDTPSHNFKFLFPFWPKNRSLSLPFNRLLSHPKEYN